MRILTHRYAALGMSMKPACADGIIGGRRGRVGWCAEAHPTRLHAVAVSQENLPAHTTGQIQIDVGGADQYVRIYVEDVPLPDGPSHATSPAKR